MMKVLILAAGYGTRLYPIVKNTPKPLLDIGGKSLIDHLLDKVKTAGGLSEVIVVTNDKFYGLFHLWAKKKDFCAPVTVINDGTSSPEDRLGSVGDIEFVLNNYVIDDDLLVLGGDNLFDYTLDDYVAFARKNNPSVTIGLYDIHSLKDAARFGVVEIYDNGRIRTFEEKPMRPKSSLIAMCSYYFPQRSLDLIHEYMRTNRHTDKAGDYIQWLVGKADVYGFEFKGTWYDIGSIESLKEARSKFK
ncbi:MAG: nucleotidyltransferase family protein [Candidatus Omnitrophota bacterium]